MDSKAAWASASGLRPVITFWTAGLIDGPARDGWAYVLFGSRPDAVGWLVVATGNPPAELLSRVRHL